MLTNKLIIDEFREERRRPGRLVHVHVYEDKYSWRHITLDEDVFRLEYGDEDGDHCDIGIPLGVVLCLLSRAGYSIRQPISAVGGK